MKRIAIVAMMFAACGHSREYEPNELEIARHCREVYDLARDYVVDTFNLRVAEEGAFNPVRFNSHGVWGNFEARIKELGDNRFEVQGWLSAVGNDPHKIRWTVHVRYEMNDPEAWRYRKIGESLETQPEFLGWQFGDYHSIGYRADYDTGFVSRTFK